ncbi:dephospho-CoA kinase [Paucibacter sp. KCTC 42545]|uniref:dephospho-CoA kinase n=1 Tax=Paucibacter sp. KCTC 42545 TaxID=1768242 RepID=UPI000733C240|nr:dephospho-CoA kinase [Paucibacter sp. KCTC 42545]ALT78268.1 dephospho-CoA kinase [Paucibacter sp. KCTC 42545]
MSRRANALQIGLTGGIGSGKSTVARLLAQAGATVIDTDAIARSLTLPQGAAMPALQTAFGPDAVAADGSLDRAWMRQQAFADSSVKQRLEAILHPLIGAETERQAAAATSSCIVFDVPLLVESGRWRQRVDRVLVVDCEEETQISRVMARNGWERAAVQAVLAQQATRAARRACADAVLFNEQLPLPALEKQVLTLAKRWF